MRGPLFACLGLVVLLATPVVSQAAPPVVGTIGFSPSQPEESETIVFTVVASDPEGDTISYLWDFGDGASSSGPSPSHFFDDDGNFQVTVTVTDFNGEFATATTTVPVVNAAPVIQSLTGDLVGEPGATLSYLAVVSDPGNDPLVYSWNWGDGSPPESGSSLDSVTHIFPSTGNYPVTLQVNDDSGGSTQTSILVVINALPVIHSATAAVASSIEGDVVSFEVIATDADLHTLSYSWDFGDGTPNISSDTPSHVFTDDGNYTVTVVVTDSLGGATSSVLPFVVANGPPELIALVGATSGVLGQSLSFNATVTDPAGSDDTLTWTWDWGEGTAPTVGVNQSSPSHSWSNAGSFTMVLTVDDEDGGSLSQSLGVQISNPGPTLSAISGVSSLDEGQAGQWTVSAADAANNPVTLTWSWGDGSADSSGLALLSPSHSYADDGVRTITVTAADAFGGTATDSLVVTVHNAPPTFTASPGTTAEEGTAYIALLSSQDPGADPPTYIPLQIPSGTLYDAGTASLVWQPTLSQVLAGPAAFEVEVDDGDGGTDLLSWFVTATWLDADLDGMADSWELSHGLDPSLDDSLGDLDGDGVSNLQEWLDLSDPTVSNGPGKPEPVSPVLGASATQEPVELVVANAADPDGDTLTYEFEVYQDETLSLLLYAGAEPEGSDGTTEHSTATGLPENTVLYWRARALDPGVAGPWSKLGEFFMDAVNNAPDTPQLLYPVATTVPGPLPVLQVAAVSDPEGDAVEVEVALYADGVGLIAAVQGSLSGADDGSWVFLLPAPLEEDLRYEWSAIATDSRGASSSASELAWFEVDATNQSPAAPEILAPAAEIDTQLPTLRASAGADPDGEEVRVRFEVDIQEDFASVHGQRLGSFAVDAEGVAAVTVPQSLPENAFVWVRARSEDQRGAASQWVQQVFFVNSVEEAPQAVQVIAPGDGEAIDPDELELRWAPSADPDGDELTYTIRITRAGDTGQETVWEQAGLLVADDGSGVSEGTEFVELELEAGGYAVEALAVDDTGLVGPWGPANSFVVLAAPGTTVDLADFGSGCACSQQSSVDSAGGLALLALWLVLLPRRRRNST